MSDDIRMIFEVLQTPAPDIPDKPREGAPAMEVIAFEYDKAKKEDEIRAKWNEAIAFAAQGGYKHVKVNMHGVGGNAYTIMGTVKVALAKAGAPLEHLQAFLGMAMSDDYDYLLYVCDMWVTIVDEKEDRGTAMSAFKRLRTE